MEAIEFSSGVRSVVFVVVTLIIVPESLADTDAPE